MGGLERLKYPNSYRKQWATGCVWVVMLPGVSTTKGNASAAPTALIHSLGDRGFGE